jgi:hypothetical protein
MPSLVFWHNGNTGIIMYISCIYIYIMYYHNMVSDICLLLTSSDIFWPWHVMIFATDIFFDLWGHQHVGWWTGWASWDRSLRSNLRSSNEKIWILKGSKYGDPDFFHGFWRDTIAVINVWLRFLCFFVQMRLEMEVLCRSYVWLWVFWFQDFQGKHMACHDATDLSPSASDSSVEIHHRFSSERSAPTVADPVMSADHSTWI